MPATPAPATFQQELYAGHRLVMQCGARADEFLDRAAAPAGRDPRAEAESLRMAALTSRLMENVRRGITLAQSGREPLVGVDLRSTRAALRAAPTPSMPKLHAAPDAPRGRLKNGNPSGDYLRAPRCH